MNDSRKEEIDKLEKSKIYCKNLTKEELQKVYSSLVKENFPDSKRIHFIADLGRSPEIAFHFELICNDWEEGTDLNFEASFDQHGQAGIDYLLELLDQKKAENQRVLIVYLLAKILSKVRHRDFYASYCKQVLPVLISLLSSSEASNRRKLIIALGWIGSISEIEILGQHLLTDQDALCRAWSASSLMQLSFHQVEKEVLIEKTKDLFGEAIAEEKDFRACALMIEAAQVLFGKKWIPTSAVEKLEIEKIEKARKSAFRFLNK
ncbi:HEAT repeat domain-containing protein [Streptococcus sp. SO4]|uniref:HEAT repeat domain-containing protein n=1 Tax=Streptococcus sp. SO4 TaxID=3018249 RepID=UPI00263EECF9|nr:HEAT repeat domain-containing protein [Streptococcus sp. SO4]MDN5024922.1 HEAT repeat domain-containing protein [Streptococcus sp. SO4]